jgi:hypothetical protein
MHITPTRQFIVIQRSIFLLAFVLLVSACSSSPKLEFWKQVPIQIARVSQTDSYQQIYILDSDSEININDLSLEQRQKLDARMDLIFIHLIGARNWQYLKNLYGVNSMREELIEKNIYMDGLVNFIAYLDPEDLDYFIMEGNGRFFAIRRKTSEILLSGDFHIPPQRFKIDAMKSGCLPMQIKFYTTRIPGKVTYYQDTTVQYDLRTRPIRKQSDAYTVDYEKPHYAYLDLDGNGEFDKQELFGSLQLNTRYHHAKLIDLGGRNFIKDQYKTSDRAELEANVAAQEDKSRQCVMDKD